MREKNPYIQYCGCHCPLIPKAIMNRNWFSFAICYIPVVLPSVERFRLHYRIRKKSFNFSSSPSFLLFVLLYNVWTLLYKASKWNHIAERVLKSKSCRYGNVLPEEGRMAHHTMRQQTKKHIPPSLPPSETQPSLLLVQVWMVTKGGGESSFGADKQVSK